jgi:hypothetical protein
MLTCIAAHWIFYLCIVTAALLSMIPVLGKFLNVLNTLVHESGHAVMALLTGGGVMNIKLSADTSGAAQTKSKYWMGKVITSVSGYPVSALTAWLFFWLIEQQKINYIYYVLISLILINLILWVRNTFGIIWLIIMGSICSLLYIYGNQIAQYYFATFCAAIILFQSIYTCIVLVTISIKSPAKAGDAKNLKEFTYIPTVIWALIMLAIVILICAKVYVLFPCM